MIKIPFIYGTGGFMQNKITKFDELKNLVGDLDKLNPIVSSEYLKTISEYEIDNQEIHCQCLEGRGTICNQKHIHGYIVQLKNKSYSIIGNQCVKKFDPNAQIRKDISLYNNEQRRLKKLESIKSYVDDIQTYRVKIDKALAKNNEFESMKSSFEAIMGNELERFRSCSSTIKITGIRSQNANNKEKTRIPLTVGQVKGKSSVCFEDKYHQLKLAIDTFEKGMNNLVALLDKIVSDNYNPKEKEITAYRNQLEKIKEVDYLIDEIESDWMSFKNNDSKSLVFAYEKPYNLIKYLLNISKLDAKTYCTKIENDFKKENNLESISKTQMTLIRSSNAFG